VIIAHLLYAAVLGILSQGSFISLQRGLLDIAMLNKRQCRDILTQAEPHFDFY
jgi:hypothetical protein